jgi:Ca-activated chloride channel family protein
MTPTWSLDRPLLPRGVRSTVGVLLRCEGKAPAAHAAPPANLTLVLDTSGSMAGTRLAHVREAALALARGLRAVDRLAVVTFANSARVLSDGVDLDATALEGLLAGLRADGGTNLSAGWIEGLRQARAAHRPGAASRMVLLTDGEVNLGLTDPGTLACWAAASRTQGILTSCVGVGGQFQEHLLAALAHEGGGRLHVVGDQAAEVGASLAGELALARTVSAQGVILELTMAPCVRRARQLGSYPVELDAARRLVRVRPADVCGGASVVVGLELDVELDTKLGPVELARGALRWVDPTSLGPGGPAERELDVVVSARAALLEEIERVGVFTNEGVIDLACLRLARAQRRALRAVDAGDLDGARRLLAAARDTVAPIAGHRVLRARLAALTALERTLNETPTRAERGSMLRKTLTRDVLNSSSYSSMDMEIEGAPNEVDCSLDEDERR